MGDLYSRRRRQEGDRNTRVKIRNSKKLVFAKKSSKAGKRFGFSRFLNYYYVKRNRSRVENGNHKLLVDEIQNNNRIIIINNVIIMKADNNMKSIIPVVVPLDIQIEIMKRLPTKSLMKFMSVSKQWKSIIQSSRFIADYNASQPPRHLFSCYSFPNNIDIFNYDNNNSFHQRLVPPLQNFFVDFIGYSQGLFGFHYRKDGVLVLWNPSIRKSVFIPIVLPERSAQFFFTGVCKKNATNEPTIFGITYDKSRGQVHIHTLTSGVWRTFSCATSRESIKLTYKRIVMDRLIYWIASDYTPEGDFLNRMIVSCDVTSEQFIELCLPPCLATSHNLELFELNRSLVVLETEIVGKTEFGVWMMMMDQPGGVQNSFTKLYTVKIPYTCRPSVLGFRKDGQLVLQKDDSRGGRKLLSYEPDSERFNEFKNTPGNMCYTRLADSYTETLLLLDHPDCISCL